jgi:Domain of unknown function (DUF4328)/Protein of unknown function (DUF2510)
MHDDVSGYPGAPPGWYADPAGGPGQRWWDGYAWTEATVLPSTPPPPPGSTAMASLAHQAPPAAPAYLGSQPGLHRQPNAADLVAREAAMVPRARVAVIAYGTTLILNLINERLQRAQLRTLGHEYHRIFTAIQHNRTAPTISNQPEDSLGLILGLLAIVAIIFALVWQFRAASAARALGYPATRSPAWGVGCWFVPVVNLWMPYQAVRDCLPPGDPNRPHVLRWWLVLTGAWALSSACGIAALFSSSVALGVSIPAAVFALGVIATAPRVVMAISSQHQAALDGAGRN